MHGGLGKVLNILDLKLTGFNFTVWVVKRHNYLIFIANNQIYLPLRACLMGEFFLVKN